MAEKRIIEGIVSHLSIQGDEKTKNIVMVRVGEKTFFDLRTKAKSLSEVHQNMAGGSPIKVEYVNSNEWKILQVLPAPKTNPQPSPALTPAPAPIAAAPKRKVHPGATAFSRATTATRPSVQPELESETELDLVDDPEVIAEPESEEEEEGEENTYTREGINSMKKKEMISLCAELELDTKGNKSALADRICEYFNIE